MKEQLKDLVKKYLDQVEELNKVPSGSEEKLRAMEKAVTINQCIIDILKILNGL